MLKTICNHIRYCTFLKKKNNVRYCNIFKIWVGAIRVGSRPSHMNSLSFRLSLGPPWTRAQAKHDLLTITLYSYMHYSLVNWPSPHFNADSPVSITGLNDQLYFIYYILKIWGFLGYLGNQTQIPRWKMFWVFDKRYPLLGNNGLRNKDYSAQPNLEGMRI